MTVFLYFYSKFFDIRLISKSLNTKNCSNLHQDTFARRKTFVRRHFCTRGHFCTKTILHKESFLHESKKSMKH